MQLTPFLSLFFLSQCYFGAAQILNFTDLELKSYLVNENSIDTNQNGSADISVDLNMDGEIQLSELQSFDSLEIGYFSNSYTIKSLQDLSGFHFKYLKVLYNDSLTNFSNLQLDSLTYLWIGECYHLKHIDISDLAAIQNLRIEGINRIDYLNLQNGSVPSGTFSLFYSEDIQYACVDSIAKEYNQVAFHMAAGQLPTINCWTNLTTIDATPSVTLFPNPSNQFITIESAASINHINIMSSDGKKTNQLSYRKHHN